MPSIDFRAEMEQFGGRSESLWFREAFMSHPSYSARSKFAAENIDEIMEMRKARGCPPVPPLPIPKTIASKKKRRNLTLFQYFVLLLRGQYKQVFQDIQHHQFFLCYANDVYSLPF